MRAGFVQQRDGSKHSLAALALHHTNQEFEHCLERCIFGQELERLLLRIHKELRTLAFGDFRSQLNVRRVRRFGEFMLAQHCERQRLVHREHLLVG